MREHRGQPVNNDKGQSLIDPSKPDSGAASQAAAAETFASSRRSAVAPRLSEPESAAGPASTATAVTCGPGAAAGSLDAPMNARLRRHARLRTRQALAPLRTAMWAAYPPVWIAAA